MEDPFSLLFIFVDRTVSTFAFRHRPLELKCGRRIASCNQVHRNANLKRGRVSLRLARRLTLLLRSSSNARPSCFDRSKTYLTNLCQLLRCWHLWPEGYDRQKHRHCFQRCKHFVRFACPIAQDARPSSLADTHRRPPTCLSCTARLCIVVQVSVRFRTLWVRLDSSGCGLDLLMIGWRRLARSGSRVFFGVISSSFHPANEKPVVLRVVLPVDLLRSRTVREEGTLRTVRRLTNFLRSSSDLRASLSNNESRAPHSVSIF